MQELAWLASTYQQPDTVIQLAPPAAIDRFQSLLYSHRYGEQLSNYGMDAEELSKLCCSRWLSSDHVRWVSEQLNKAQIKARCIYLNFISDVNSYGARQLAVLPTNPLRLVFGINVGRDNFGNVYLGSDAQPGQHWLMCFVDSSNKDIIYGDSLAWPAPMNLRMKVEQYLKAVYGHNVSTHKFKHCHEPSSSKHVAPVAEIHARHCNPYRPAAAFAE